MTTSLDIPALLREAAEALKRLDGKSAAPSAAGCCTTGRQYIDGKRMGDLVRDLEDAAWHVERRAGK